MKSTEFIFEKLNLDEIYDIGKWQLEFISKEFQKNSPELYESSDNVVKFNAFIRDYSITPIIDEIYYPISIIALPIGKMVNLAISTSPGKLTKITEANLFFNFGSGERPFPYNLEGSDMLQTTVLFHSLPEQEKFREWMHLSFNDSWKISTKLL